MLAMVGDYDNCWWIDRTMKMKYRELSGIDRTINTFVVRTGLFKDDLEGK